MKRDFSGKIKNNGTFISDKISSSQEIIPIQVGIDYGTSSTKIVFSEIGGRLFKPIVFNHNLPHYPEFVIPSVMAIDDDNKLQIGIEAAQYLANKSWREGFLRLKMIVAGRYDKAFFEENTEKIFQAYINFHSEKTDGYRPEKLTAIYLAYVIRKARKFIEDLPEYENQKLDLIFNINMPIEHRENNNVRPVFEKIFAWAELIEKDWPKEADHSILMELSEDKSRIAMFNPENPSARVFAVPESVAGIASYLISLEKKDGLHAIIDLGSGTTDVSIFNLREEIDRSLKNYWYAARNIPWGMINVEEFLVERFFFGCQTKEICTFKKLVEYLDDVGEMKYAIRDKMMKFCKTPEYRNPWKEAYGKLKSQLVWENVQVFVCGGGANLPLLDKVFCHPWNSMIRACYPVNGLPEPDNYDSIEGTVPFQRMTVAYGLSIPIPLNDYVLPADAPNHTPPRLPMKKMFDHENLYPK